MTLKLYAVLFLGLFSMGAKCQEVALKSNLLYDAFATLNAGVETGLADARRIRQLQRMDTLARPEVEALASATRSSLLVLRPMGRTLRGSTPARRPIQRRRAEKRLLFSGKRLLQTLRPALPRMVPGRGRGIRVFLDSGQALEPGSRNRLRICLHAIRRLPLRQLRNKTRERQTAPLCRSYQGRGKPCIHILNSSGGYGHYEQIS